MIKIAHDHEVELYLNQMSDDKQSKGIHKEILVVTRGIVKILDEAYGANRNVDGGLGGYVLILEDMNDQLLLANVHIDIYDMIPEYVDRITINNGDEWVCAMFLLNSDFSVSVILESKLAPNFLLQQMEDEHANTDNLLSHNEELSKDSESEYSVSRKPL